MLSRLILLLASTLLSAALAWLVWGWLRPTRDVEIVDTLPSVRELLVSRQHSGDLPPADPGHWSSLPEEVVRVFYPAIQRPFYEYHPILYLRRPARMDFRFGSLDLRTDSRGMRNDEEPSSERPDLRILVTGDSHTEGVVPNRQNFVHRLGEALRSERPGLRVETLNAGVGHYNFYNYHGVIRAYADLRPDLLIVVVYGGNDFSGSMMLERYFSRRGPPSEEPYSAAALQRLLAEQPEERGAYAQDLAQLVYFLNNPEDEARAVATGVALSRKTAERCRGACRPLFVYLPPASRVQYPHFASRYARSLAALGIEEQDLALSDRLAEAWMAELAALGIPVLDLRPAFAATERPYYRARDLHLDAAGHEALAAILREELRRTGAARSTP